MNQLRRKNTVQRTFHKPDLDICMDMKIKSEFIARRLSDRQHVIRIKKPA